MHSTYLQLAFQAKNISTEALEVITEALVIFLKNNRVIFGDLRAIQDKGIVASCTGPTTATANLFFGLLKKIIFLLNSLLFCHLQRDILMMDLLSGNTVQPCNRPKILATISVYHEQP